MGISRGTAPWLVLVLAATAVGGPWLAQRGASDVEPGPGANPIAARADDMPVTEVKRGKITVTVREPGSVGASRHAGGFSLVEGQTTIIPIRAEGAGGAKGPLV